MSDPPKTSEKKPRSKRKTLILLVAIAVVIFLVLGTSVLFLPFVVSSDRSRRLVEEKTSEILNRPVHIENIRWTWTDGIAVRGMLLDDDPEFSDKPFLSLSEAKIRIDFFALADRTAVLDVAVTGLDVRLIRNKAGLTNLEALLSQLGGKDTAPPPPTPSGEKFVLPGNLRCGIRLEKISVFVDDRLGGSTLAAKNAAVTLDIPSLLEKPIQLAVSSDLEMDGKSVPPLNIGLTVTDLFHTDGSINLAAVKADFSGTLPGASVTLNADMTKSEVRTGIQADLSQLADLAKPFLPPAMSQAKIVGTMTIRTLIKNAFDVEKGLTIETAYVETDGNLPGIRFSANGGLSQQKVVCTLSVDLPKLVNLARPFIPEPFSGTDVHGSVDFSFETTGDPKKKLVFDMNLKASEFLVSGGPVAQGTVGPANMGLSIKGDAEPLPGIFTIREGGIRCFKNTDIRFAGEARQNRENVAEASFHAGPAHIDLGEIIAAVRPILPPDLPIFQDIQNRPPTLTFKEIRLDGNSTDGPKTIEIDALALNLPAVRVEAKPDTVGIDDLGLTVNTLKVALAQFFPKRVELSASAGIGSVNVKGEQDLTVKKIAITNLSVTSDNISRPEKSLFGVGGDFTISETLNVGEVTLPSLATLKTVSQSLAAVAVLLNDETARIAVKDMKLDLPFVSVKTPEYGTVQTASALRATVAEIALGTLSPLRVDVMKAGADFEMGDFLSAHLDANAKNLGESQLQAKGTLALRLKQLAKMIPAKLLKEPKLGGDAAIEWQVSGRLPTVNETRNLEQLKTFDPKKDLAFLNELKFVCNLRDVLADVALPDGTPIKIGPVSTETPIAYAYRGETGEGQLEGMISLKKIAALPSLEPPVPPSVNVAFNARHDGIKSVTLTQSLELDILNFKENLDMSISGGDRIFGKNLSAPPPLWLKYVGGKLACGVSISHKGKPETVTEGIALGGEVDASVELKLTPGQTASLSAQAQTRDISVLADGLADVRGLRTDLKIGREYRLRFDEKTETAKDRTGDLSLSAEVLKTNLERAVGSVDENAAVSGFVDQMQSRYGADHAISFSSAHVTTGPLPLDIGPCQADLELSGMPGLDHFQVDVLGGTVMGETAFLQINNDFFLKAQVAFSGIDTKKLFPGGVMKDTKGEDAELTGRLSVALPLTTSMDAMLQRIQLGLRFGHIGSKALEWILYSLDPTESDESVVSLRKLLQTGSPRWINVEIKDGGLSLSGEVDVKGVSVSIPRIERLNIANLSGLQKYEQDLEPIQALVEVLKLSLATTIVIDEKGDVAVTE